MAELWYGHFDSGRDDRRVLSADRWAKYIKSLITNGVRNGGTNMQVTVKQNMLLNVDTGMANINGYIVMLDEDFNGRYYEALVPAAHPQYPRIDRLVLRLDTSEEARKITPVISRGTAAESPEPPALKREGYIYELSLAQIYVAAGTVYITNDDITDERFDTEACGLINSVLGLDPSVWQKQFDDFMSATAGEKENILLAFEREFERTQAEKQAEFERTQTEKQTAWDEWFAKIMIDPQRYITFDFDNLANLKGVTRTTPHETDSEIMEEIRITAGGALVATRHTVSSEDNGIETIISTEKVFDSDGVTILRQATITTTIDENDNVTEVVSA